MQIPLQQTLYDVQPPFPYVIGAFYSENVLLITVLIMFVEKFKNRLSCDISLHFLFRGALSFSVSKIALISWYKARYMQYQNSDSIIWCCEYAHNVSVSTLTTAVSTHVTAVNTLVTAVSTLITPYMSTLMCMSILITGVLVGLLVCILTFQKSKLIGLYSF